MLDSADACDSLLGSCEEGDSVTRVLVAPLLLALLLVFGILSVVLGLRYPIARGRNSFFCGFESLPLELLRGFLLLLVHLVYTP